MGYHPRIEGKDLVTFQTTRTIRSELWFIKNHEFENAILGYLAKYKKRYGAHVYAFAIEGNHIQFPAMFPNANRAHFMRDFNSSVARSLPFYQKTFKGGKVFARRYSGDIIPWQDDLLVNFIYTVLQPVQDGLVDDIKHYQGYNCFEDAIHEREREFYVVDWKRYNAAVNRNKVKIPDIMNYTERVILKYDRLPQFKDMSQEDYIKMMREIIATCTKEILENRKMDEFLDRLEETEANERRRKEWAKYTVVKEFSEAIKRGVKAKADADSAAAQEAPLASVPYSKEVTERQGGEECNKSQATKLDNITEQPRKSDNSKKCKNSEKRRKSKKEMELQDLVDAMASHKTNSSGEFEPPFKLEEIIKEYRRDWIDKQPGDIPFFTKTSTMDSHRPRVLSNDLIRREKGLAWYFAIYEKYKEASKAFREGNLLVEFPQGTYRPPTFTVAIESAEIMLR